MSSTFPPPSYPRPSPPRSRSIPPDPRQAFPPVARTSPRITIDGEDDAGRVRRTFHVVDRYDPVTGISSMARTTGYTATAIARFVLAGHYSDPGVVAPETLGAAGALEWVVRNLNARGIAVTVESERQADTR